MAKTPDRFRKLVDGAFDWFSDNLDLFDPFKGGTDPDIFLSKPLLELACTCMYYERCTRGHRDTRVCRFVSFVNDVWLRPEYRELMVRHPQLLRMYGMTWIALRQCGAADPSGHELIQRVIEEGYVTAIEEVPFRRLDFRYMLDCGGFRHDFPSYASLYQQTLLAKAPSLLYLTDNDVYSITHTIFYVVDFGSASPEVIPHEQLAAVRWMVGALLGIYVRLRHWDLVAELLICCRCLRWAPPLVWEAAWDGLMEAQLPDGCVPAPTFSRGRMQQLTGNDERRYYVTQNYHTTLVAAIAGFLSDEWVATDSPAPTEP
jgi:hypothetical protein